MPDQQSCAQTGPSLLQQQTPKMPFLRRCSISDPHLDIVPHFAHEKSANPINRVLSGLFEGNSAFSLNKLGASTESVDRAGGITSPTNDPHLQLQKGTGAVEFKSPPASQEARLRKSATSISALFGTSPQPHHFPAIPETDDRGLIMMSARPSSSMPKQVEQQASSASAPTTAASPPKSGFKGMFGRGFLAKPVLHNQEENYRYIMALDR